MHEPGVHNFTHRFTVHNPLVFDFSIASLDICASAESKCLIGSY
jgi:hypothetical protein